LMSPCLWRAKRPLSRGHVDPGAPDQRALHLPAPHVHPRGQS
jgi:hypothetical protein